MDNRGQDRKNSWLVSKLERGLGQGLRLIRKLLLAVLLMGFTLGLCGENTAEARQCVDFDEYASNSDCSFPTNKAGWFNYSINSNFYERERGTRIKWYIFPVRKWFDNPNYCSNWGATHGKDCNGNFKKQFFWYDRVGMIKVVNSDPFFPQYGVWAFAYDKNPKSSSPSIFGSGDVVDTMTNSIRCRDSSRSKWTGEGYDVCVYRGSSRLSIAPNRELEDGKRLCEGEDCVCAIGETKVGAIWQDPSLIGCVSVPMMPAPPLYEPAIIDPNYLKVPPFCMSESCGQDDIKRWAWNINGSPERSYFDDPKIYIKDRTRNLYLKPKARVTEAGTGLVYEVGRGGRKGSGSINTLCALQVIGGERDGEELGCVPIPAIMDSARFAITASYERVYRKVTNSRTSEYLPFHGVKPFLISENNTGEDRPVVTMSTIFTSSENPDNEDGNIALGNDYNLYYQNNDKFLADCELSHYVSNVRNNNEVNVCRKKGSDKFEIKEIESHIIASTMYDFSAPEGQTNEPSNPNMPYKVGDAVTEGELLMLDESGRGFYKNTLQTVITNKESIDPVALVIQYSDAKKKATVEKDDAAYEGLTEEEIKDLKAESANVSAYISVSGRRVDNDSASRLYSLDEPNSRVYYKRSGKRYRDHCYTDTMSLKWPYYPFRPQDLGSEEEKKVVDKGTIHFYLDRRIEPGTASVNADSPRLYPVGLYKNSYEELTDKEKEDFKSVYGNKSYKELTDEEKLDFIERYKKPTSKLTQEDKLLIDKKTEEQIAACPGLYIGGDQEKDKQDIICLVSSDPLKWDFISGRNHQLISKKSEKNLAPAPLCAGIPSRCFMRTNAIGNLYPMVGALGVDQGSILISKTKPLDNKAEIVAGTTCPNGPASWVKKSPSDEKIIVLRCVNGILMPLDLTTGGEVAPPYQDVCLEKNGELPVLPPPADPNQQNTGG